MPLAYRPLLFAAFCAIAFGAFPGDVRAAPASQDDKTQEDIQNQIDDLRRQLDKNKKKQKQLKKKKGKSSKATKQKIRKLKQQAKELQRRLDGLLGSPGYLSFVTPTNLIGAGVLGVALKEHIEDNREGDPVSP